MNAFRTGLAFLFLAPLSFAADSTERKSPKDALKAFNDLVGKWRGTGEPEGTRAEKLQGFWSESIAWEWQFKGNDVWLKLAIDKSKHLSTGELRYVPDKDVFRLTVVSPEKETRTFEGPLVGKRLTLEREDPKTKDMQRLVFSFLHSNRYLYRYEVKRAERLTFAKIYQVGATKEGIPFAGPGDTSPECIVSGGKGTIAVTHKGKTYYVCCTGCRDEFKDKPEKYIKEFEEKKVKEAKEKTDK
jgi:YHS domain-containing protein